MHFVERVYIFFTSLHSKTFESVCHCSLNLIYINMLSWSRHFTLHMWCVCSAILLMYFKFSTPLELCYGRCDIVVELGATLQLKWTQTNTVFVRIYRTHERSIKDKSMKTYLNAVNFVILNQTTLRRCDSKLCVANTVHGYDCVQC